MVVVGYYAVRDLSLRTLNFTREHKREFWRTKRTRSTECGRKNSPIWEGHSFGWGGRTVVGSASSNSGVRAVFSVHHGVVGRTSSLYCWGIYKKWRVAGSNTVAAAFARFDPLRFFSLGLPQSKGLRTRTTSPKFGSSEGGDTTGSCCHYTWNDSQGHGYISVSIFKAATWVMFCSKHVDVKRHFVYFPEIKKHFPYLLWFLIY